jgi:hypothetical protein
VLFVTYLWGKPWPGPHLNPSTLQLRRVPYLSWENTLYIPEDREQRRGQVSLADKSLKRPGREPRNRRKGTRPFPT